MKSAWLLGMAAAGLIGAAGVANAADVAHTYPSPSLDRWFYPFSFGGGSEGEATIFAPFGDPTEAMFDDRDGQMVVGFSTATEFTPGLGASHYRVISASVTATVSRENSFNYDPTMDSWQTYAPTGGAAPVADSDAGRSVELYLAGYRNAWSLATFVESTRFTGAAGSPGGGSPLPARAIRNIYPAEYNPAASGVVRDVSNNVDDQFDARPLAMGTSSVLTPGQLVPRDAVFTFAFDFANPDARKYLRECLNAGKMNFVIASLAEARRENPQAMAFYTKESGLPDTAPTMSLRVCIGEPGDWNCSGTKTADDIFAFLDDWFSSRGDFNEDGTTTADDIFAFLDAWFMQ